jgi:hypothetical protein
MMKFFRMKPFALLLATAAVALSADFFTGQAARLVIGQETFTAQSSELNANTLGGVGGVAFANNTLFVADSNRVGAGPMNHRVLIYKNVTEEITLPVNAAVPQVAGKLCPACRGTASLVLGQENFAVNDLKLVPTNASLRQPNAVATDGVRLVVSDTDNNRVLIWNSLPTWNNQPADLVLGQESFTTNRVTNPPTASSLRGPQGVWIQGNRLMVADTSNNRVLIWNTFPTQNNQAANVVIGAPNFTTRVELDLVVTRIDPKADNLLNPVSVTSDGQRLFVADLGFNRVMIWNTIPTQNAQAADLVLGQPDFTSAVANNSASLCPSNGQRDGQNTFPRLCAATIEFPRFVLSDGRRLFVADGGNDRILVYNNLPTANGQKADTILGQVGESLNRSSDSAFPLLRSSTDQLRTPMSLAFDGTNLYVADPFNRRVMVFSTHDQPIPYTAVRNAASLDVFATGTIGLSGTVRENDEITINIRKGEQTNAYVYKIARTDTVSTLLSNLVAVINAKPDPFVTASIIPDLSTLLLTAREGGEGGNLVEISTSTAPTDALIVLTTGGAFLTGGQDAARVAPGSIVSVLGPELAGTVAAAPEGAENLPTELGNVQLYLDGKLAPLFLVSPTRINAQIPWEFFDRNSVSAYVRRTHPDGRVTTTMPVAVQMISENPGLFAIEGTDPRQGIVQHFSSRATGTVSVDGSIQKDDVATVIIEGREYSYTVKETDSLADVRDGLILEINKDEQVEAFAAGVFTRIRLRARVPGEAGNGIVYSTRTNDSAQVILTATTPNLCCANTEGASVTVENPALPGQTIVVFGTGLGRLRESFAQNLAQTGAIYRGPILNEPSAFVSSLAGGKTANVLYAALRPGSIGLYEIHLELNSDLPTNSATQLTIAQDIYVSNVITFPLRNPTEVVVEPAAP